MQVVWDEPKRLANIDKHGLDFADLSEAFFADALILPAKKGRWMGIGANLQGVHLRRFREAGERRHRWVSMRPAKANERKWYAEALKA